MQAVLWIGPDADPLRRVAGLSLAARNERVARSAGAQRVFFVCPSPTRAAELRGALVSELPDCPVVSLDELPASASVTHDSHADEDVLLLCAHAVYHPEAVALLAAPHVREVSSLVDASGRALGAYRLRAETLREVLRRGAGSLTEVERAVTDARIPRQEVATGSGWSVIPVGDAASARLAADKLWAACRKPVDGLVSRNLNRHISLWISRRLVDTRITPNHISLLCIGLGLVAGALAAQGGYAWILAGAAPAAARLLRDAHLPVRVGGRGAPHARRGLSGRPQRVFLRVRFPARSQPAAPGKASRKPGRRLAF